ncbi:hypothetical protein [Pedobacter glucosidilyticus]|uniref:hypothetical protein n=1 Tax=Pedobacter glucosidilyticus TaxID=1122941 RepID=UPI0026EF47B0|nr:hypothetical protein [Pedobacter glucosidilyticus]
MTHIQKRSRALRIPPLKKEHLSIIISLMLFVIAPVWLRLVDETAAPLDAGILSAILVAILAFLLFKALTWWLIENIWPVLGNFSKEQFHTHFNHLSSCQKIIIYLSFYLLLLYGFICTLIAIL